MTNEDKVRSYIRGIVSEAVNEAMEETMNGKQTVEDFNKYVPKKAFKMIEKINAALKELKNLTGEDYPILLSTDTGSEWFYEIRGDVTIENGVMKWVEYDTNYGRGKLHKEEWNLVREDDDEGSYWFDEYEFKDQLHYLNSGIRKAIKYFKEYNPEMDDDEKAHDKFINDL